MPRRSRTTGNPNGRPRQIPQPLRDLIWKLYHEKLYDEKLHDEKKRRRRRTRSISDVAQWLDEHDIPPPGGGWWHKSTIHCVLDTYRKEKVLREDREYDVLIEYERQSLARAAQITPTRRVD